MTHNLRVQNQSLQNQFKKRENSSSSPTHQALEGDKFTHLPQYFLMLTNPFGFFFSRQSYAYQPYPTQFPCAVAVGESQPLHSSHSYPQSHKPKFKNTDTTQRPTVHPQRHGRSVPLKIILASYLEIQSYTRQLLK